VSVLLHVLLCMSLIFSDCRPRRHQGCHRAVPQDEDRECGDLPTRWSCADAATLYDVRIPLCPNIASHTPIALVALLLYRSPPGSTRVSTTTRTSPLVSATSETGTCLPSLP
jgi:hypothetical protein